MAFIKAVKYDSKLRLALAGPSGSGKTWTSLLFAESLADGGAIALIDTEHGSASKYADRFSFDTLLLDNFHPERYVEAIHEAEVSGYQVLIIDSLSHAWNGQGGLLELVDGIAKRKYGGNTFAAWKDATPFQNALTEAILRSNLHIIATMRSKEEHVQEKDERGKTVIRKMGMAPVQREGMVYEFDVWGNLDNDNTLMVEKSRCPELSGAVITKPGAQVALTLKTWLSGAPVPIRERPTPEAIDHMRAYVGRVFGFKDDEFESRWNACKVHVLGRSVADPDLFMDDLSKIQAFTSAEEKKPKSVKAAGGGR